MKRGFRPDDPLWQALWFWVVIGFLITMCMVTNVTLSAPAVHWTSL